MTARHPNIVAFTQVDDSDHRIPQDPTGKMRESHRILQENAGNRWNMEAVFRPEIVRIFSGRLLPISCAFLQELAGNDRKKSEKFPAGILLPCSSDFRCFPAGTGPYFLTWVYEWFFGTLVSQEKNMLLS